MPSAPKCPAKISRYIKALDGKATINSTSALFDFRIVHPSTTWIWNISEDNTLEYYWGAEFSLWGGHYIVGFYEWARTDISRHKAGTIFSLLNDPMSSVCCYKDNGDGTCDLVETITQLSTEVSTHVSGLALKSEDLSLVAQMRAERPKTATFQWGGTLYPQASATIAMEYL